MCYLKDRRLHSPVKGIENNEERKVKTVFVACLTALTFVTVTRAADFHVAPHGNDANPGTPTAPFRTIQHAADLAQAGDVITVHEGVYRERISPPRGGESDTKRIVYQAAPGEKVEIKGSEVVKNWVKVGNDTWKVTLPNAFFGSFNPYSDLIHGDWFSPKGRNHHTGAVYLNGDWLTEAAKLDDVMKPMESTALWFGEVDEKNTTISAQFKGVNPNQQLVEINVRQTVFYPEKTGINYLTVRGFSMEDAATPWAPPTTEQIGLIGTHWSKGWIIENNTISYSTCSGIALGRARTNGWSKENIGHHIVRNNTISHCEQAGIVGMMGAVFSIITGNTIHDIHVRKLFDGAEMAGIKIHGGIDVEISRNHIYRTCLGLWLDWAGQNMRVSQNLFHDNGRNGDLVVEIQHGPFLIDNNLFLSPLSLSDDSQGGAYVHNLFAGAVNFMAINRHFLDKRQTPFFKAHSTEIAGSHDNPIGDDRYYNNLFVQGADLSNYNNAPLPVWMKGNVFLKGAKPPKYEKYPVVKPDLDPAIRLVEEADGFYLEIRYDPVWSKKRRRQLVTTKLLGRAIIPKVPYEQPDGEPIRINTDYFGRSRNEANPTPGPFENPGQGDLKLKVWGSHS
jgi:alpha-N-arabinofuranosidase